MEQANKPTFLQVDANHEYGVAISTFLTTIGWLLLIGTVILMALWAAKSVRHL